MEINDKVLTIATGLMLAIGGGAASLLLGDHGEQETVIVAGLTDTGTPAPRGTPIILDIPPASSLTIAEPTEPPTKVAAVDPVARAALPGSGPDLAEVRVQDGAPTLGQLADFSDIVLTSAIPTVAPPGSPRSASVEPVRFLDGPVALALPPTPVADCTLDIRATALSGARVRLKLTAPCHPNVIATVEHAGLRFKERLDERGVLELKVPVFEEFSEFSVMLADGTRTTVGTYIADLSSVERVGLSWNGADDTFLHVFENGADWDEPGHVWRVNPRGLAGARMQGGGYLMRLGDASLPDPALVQVYSLPASGPAAIARLEIETLRAEAECGGSMALTLATAMNGDNALLRRVTTTLPPCGEPASLLLKNVVKDLKVAAY